MSLKSGLQNGFSGFWTSIKLGFLEPNFTAPDYNFWTRPHNVLLVPIFLGQSWLLQRPLQRPLQCPESGGTIRGGGKTRKVCVHEIYFYFTNLISATVRNDFSHFVMLKHLPKKPAVKFVRTAYRLNLSIKYKHGHVFNENWWRNRIHVISRI